MKSDIRLLESIRKMDREALIRVFDEYAPILYNYVIRTCQDALTADQIVGDVFAKFLEQLSAGKGPTSNLRSYLFEAAYNLLVDHIRRDDRQLSLEKSVIHFPAALVASYDLEQILLYEAVSQAILHNLTEIQRNVIILRFMEGLSPRETAQVLGKSENVVKVTQNRAIASLRKCLYQWVFA